LVIWKMEMGENLKKKKTLRWESLIGLVMCDNVVSFVGKVGRWGKGVRLFTLYAVWLLWLRTQLCSMENKTTDINSWISCFLKWQARRNKTWVQQVIPQAVHGDRLQHCRIFWAVDLWVGQGVSDLEEPTGKGDDSMLWKGSHYLFRGVKHEGFYQFP
jgi:hypothetical protein